MTTIKKWSSSALSLYETCPQAAKLQHLDKMEGKKSPRANRGNQIHKAAEQFLKKEIQELPTELKTFAGLLQRLRNGNPLVEEPWGFDNEWNIVPFDTAWVRGLLDAAEWISETHLHGHDWKTGKRYPPKHLQQEQLYAVFAFARFPQLEQFSFSFDYVDETGPENECSTFRTYTRQQAEKLRENFERRARRMLNDEIFAPKASKVNCRFCAFNEQCTWAVK